MELASPGGTAARAGSASTACHQRAGNTQPACQAITQQLPATGQALGDRPGRPAQLAGGGLVRLAVEIAEYERSPILLGESAELGIDQAADLGRGSLVAGLGGNVHRKLRLRPTPCAGLHLQRHVARHRV